MGKKAEVLHDSIPFEYRKYNATVDALALCGPDNELGLLESGGVAHEDVMRRYEWCHSCRVALPPEIKHLRPIKTFGSSAKDQNSFGHNRWMNKNQPRAIWVLNTERKGEIVQGGRSKCPNNLLGGRRSTGFERPERW